MHWRKFFGPLYVSIEASQHYVLDTTFFNLYAIARDHGREPGVRWICLDHSQGRDVGLVFQAPFGKRIYGLSVGHFPRIPR